MLRVFSPLFFVAFRNERYRNRNESRCINYIADDYMLHFITIWLCCIFTVKNNETHSAIERGVVYDTMHTYSVAIIIFLFQHICCQQLSSQSGSCSLK